MGPWDENQVSRSRVKRQQPGHTGGETGGGARGQEGDKQPWKE